MKHRPNIVLTFADDQPAYAMGCAGNDPLRTPAMDALAARGTIFDNASHPGSHIRGAAIHSPTSGDRCDSLMCPQAKLSR